MSEPHWSDMEPRERDGWIAWKLFGWRWVGQPVDDEFQFALYPPSSPGRVIYNLPPSVIGLGLDFWPAKSDQFSDWHNMTYSEPPDHAMRFMPRYSTDVAADFEVLKIARHWKAGDWAKEGDTRCHGNDPFYQQLSEILRSRDGYYEYTVNQYELYYMDQYQPGDFSHAMYLALTEIESKPE